MTVERRHSRIVVPVSIAALLILAAAALSRRAHGFHITAVSRDQDAVDVQFEAEPECYFILQTGTDLGFLEVCADIAIAEGTGSLHHVAPPAGNGPSRFYVVRQVPLNVPLDSDQDLIDDATELNHSFLDPLDAADAGEDQDGDGVDNVTEHLQGRDLTVGAVPDTNQIVALTVHTPLEPW